MKRYLIALALLALASPAFAQSLPTPNLGTGTQINGTAIGSLPLGVTKGGTGVGTITGLVKGAGTSAFVAAVAGTDYAPITSGSVPLKGNGAGGTAAATAADMAALHGGSSTPLINGTAAVGTSNNFARDDHRHPTDTTRAAAATTITPSGSITGGGDLSANRTLAYSGDGAWTTYTPAVTCGTGSVTMTSVAGAYKRLGDKTVAFRVKAVINVNSACTSFGLSLPFAPNADLSLTGRESVASGQMFGGNATAGSAAFILFYYNNTNVAANGATFTFGATYDTP